MKIKTNGLMSPACFALLLCLSCIVTNGQRKEAVLKKIYLQLGTGAGSHDGSISEFGVQTVLKHNWTIAVLYHSIEMDPKNLPADYDPGYVIILPGVYPTVKMNLFNVTTGKLFQTGAKSWLTTEAGLSFVEGQNMNFIHKAADNGGWYSSPNYDETTKNKNTIGGMVKADFSWAFLPFLGLGAGVFANFNAIQSPVGFQVKLITGWMNTKRKK